MSTVYTLEKRRTAWPLIALAMIGTFLLSCAGPHLLGGLEGALGFSSQWAYLIAGAVADGALWYIAVIAPELIPLDTTMQAIFAWGGIAGLVGW
jgi:hypothetical protein